MADNKESNGKREVAEPPALEWLAAAVGLILVVGAVGFMIYQAVVQKHTPPNISVSVDSINPTDSGFLVGFRITNRGAMTASALTIEGELKKNGESIEKSSATIDYAPSHSERRGGLIFTKNPKDFDLQIRATSYEEP